jgi:hypothetical protein
MKSPRAKGPHQQSGKSIEYGLVLEVTGLRLEQQQTRCNSLNREGERPET